MSRMRPRKHSCRSASAAAAAAAPAPMMTNSRASASRSHAYMGIVRPRLGSSERSTYTSSPSTRTRNAAMPSSAGGSRRSPLLTSNVALCHGHRPAPMRAEGRGGVVAALDSCQEHLLATDQDGHHLAVGQVLRACDALLHRGLLSRDWGTTGHTAPSLPCGQHIHFVPVSRRSTPMIRGGADHVALTGVSS